MIETGTRYRCDRCKFTVFVEDEGASKTEKDRIAKKWTVVPGTAGEKVALCPDCLNDYKLRYGKMFEEFKKER